MRVVKVLEAKSVSEVINEIWELIEQDEEQVEKHVLCRSAKVMSEVDLVASQCRRETRGVIELSSYPGKTGRNQLVDLRAEVESLSVTQYEKPAPGKGQWLVASQ